MSNFLLKLHMNKHKRKVSNIKIGSWNINSDWWPLELEGQSHVNMPIYKLESEARISALPNVISLMVAKVGPEFTSPASLPSILYRTHSGWFYSRDIRSFLQLNNPPWEGRGTTTKKSSNSKLGFIIW